MTQRIDLGIPELLDFNSSNKFEKSYLDDTGEFVVAKYTGTSSVAIGNIKAKSSNVIKSALCAEISHLALCSPFLFTLTDNFIQAINVKTSSFEQIFQDSTLNEDIKFILTNTQYLVGVGIKQLTVWERRGLQEPPRVIKMTSQQDAAGCGQIGSISQLTSFVGTTTILISNRNPSSCLFQVWDIETGALICWAKHPSKAEGKSVGEHFVTLKTCAKSGAIVGTCRGNMYIWDMSKKAEDTGKKHSLLRDPKYVLFENVIITAVHVDKNIIAVGDNTGRITVLTAGGKEVYALNSTSHSAATTAAAAAAAAAADPATVPLSKLRSVYKHKINDITRAGRWVVASDNNGHAYLCDIFTPEQTDPPEFTAPSGGQVKEVRVSNGKIVVLSHPKKESRTGFKTSKNRPDVAYWTPPQLKPNMFGSPVDHVQNWGDSPLELLSITLAKLYMSQAASALPLSRYSERLRTITRFLNEAATKEGQTEITVPFLLVQHAQKTLDAFVDLVALSEKTGKSRHKEGVPIAAKAFFRAISAMSAILEASEAPFRVKNYFESQDTQGKEAGAGPEEEAGNSPKRTNGAQRRMSLKVIRRGSDAEMDAPQKHFISQSGLHVQQKAIQENPSTNSENGATASSQGNTGVEGMLEGLDKTLTRMHKKVEEAITTFDEACSEGPLEHDKATQLLKVYSSLCQFNEDFKEMGKDIAEIRGVAPSSECPGTEPWYENGGNYEDEPASSSTGTSGGLSQGSESSLSAFSTN